MRSRICGKTCKSGFHLKGTTFEEKKPGQQLQKQTQPKYRVEIPYDFPPLPKGGNVKEQTKQAHGNGAQVAHDNFKCTDCAAAFKYKTELKNHYRADHMDNAPNQDSFLDAI